MKSKFILIKSFFFISRGDNNVSHGFNFLVFSKCGR